MMQQQDGHTAPAPRMLALPSQDATRLLDVYVKRSLSLNDNASADKKPQVKRQRSGPLMEMPSRLRRQGSKGNEVTGFTKMELTPVSESSVKPNVVSKKSEKKSKKSLFLKSILGLFSRKTSEKNEEAGAKPGKTKLSAAAQQSSVTSSCQSLHGGSQTSPYPSKLLQRKPSWKKLSRTRGSQEAKFTPVKKSTTLALFDQGHKPEIMSVEPNSTYYEKVSEELAKIVRRVKDEGQSIPEQSIKARRNIAASEKEVIDQITELLKEEGDAIEIMLKRNSKIKSFFQGLSYGSFRRLADRYVETETPEALPPEASCKELVHFAVTLDFTAKMAGLSHQPVGCIMGFGHQYLQDRFLQMNFAQFSGAPVGSQAQAAMSASYEPAGCQEQEGNFFSLD